MAPKRIPAEPVDPAPLGQPLHFEFSGKTAKNRFLKASMAEQLATWDPVNLEARGVPTKELINTYSRWGEGGFGVLLTGNFLIGYKDLEAAGNPIIPGDAPFSGERFEGFKALAKEAKAHGSMVVAQINHPGRQVSDTLNPSPISASDVQLEGTVVGLTFAKPRPMEAADFEDVVNGFAHAAEYCHKAGYDGVELHGAHGYLLAQFLSRTTNKRTDKYGGDILNRARIIFDIAAAIRERVKDPSFALGIKVNSVEFQDDGFSPEECKALCRALGEHGFDFVELSGGTYQALAFNHQRESTRRREAFFLDFADMIAPELTRTKTYVTGGLRTAKAMVDALGTVDGVGLARAVCDEFDLPAKLLRGEVQSAIDNLVDQENFAISNMAAGAQIRLVGHGHQQLDLSRQEHKDVFEKSLGQWLQTLASDASKFGHTVISNIELQPYGTPYAA